MPTLRLQLPDQTAVTHELTAAVITIGRRPDNTIQIVDRSVSAHHAELIAEDGHYRLHDLGSTNLTFVDGQAVADFHLHDTCKVSFGSVECVFDAHAGGGSRPLSFALLEKDLVFLRGENAELQRKILALQRQIDILSSARLVTKKTEVTPSAVHYDALKFIADERDELRHLSASLKLELEQLRESCAAAITERDSARRACALLQTEKATRGREQQERSRPPESLPGAGAEAPMNSSRPAVATSPAPSQVASSPNSASTAPTATLAATDIPSITVDTGDTQKIVLPLPARFQIATDALRPVRLGLETLSKNPANPAVLAEISAAAARLVDATNAVGPHPIGRLGLAMEALLQETSSHPEPPTAARLRILQQAADLMAQLLEPARLENVPLLPHPKALVVDDDTDLLQTLGATLEFAQLPTKTCTSGEAALALLAVEDFDLILLDVALPGIDGTTLCGQIRENERSWRTPVIFLTATDTLHQRAQASLSGGHDFLAKPFNAAELALKAETWIWKHRFSLL